ncbi:MAG: iron ABC transporter permease [Elusimicrobiota bacterium]
MEYALSDKSLTKKNAFKFLLIAIFGGIALISIFLSCYNGTFKIPIWHLLSGNLSENEKYIFVNIRLLRALTAIVAGGGLALCGAIMQNVLKNPMASPFTLGISQAAAFGASFSIIFLNPESSSIYTGYLGAKYFSLTIISAFISALICSAFVFFVAYIKNGEPQTVILSGIACGAFFQSMTMFIQYFTDEIKAAATLFWTFGDISKASYSSLFAITFLFIPITAYFLFSALKLNALLWGREIAFSLGVKAKKMAVISIFLVSALSAAITSILGVIGFVGLIAPHLAKITVGHDNRYFIPLSIIFGSLVLNFSDILSRIILAPAIVPVGIITSMWGVIVLIYLLIKKE